MPRLNPSEIVTYLKNKGEPCQRDITITHT